MSCPNTNNECKQNNQCQCNERRCGNGFVCIIVLYILLAIIIGSFVY